ncbi:competence/damage-inducible protein A [Natronobiforma cellulositropha]|uniref:competence/damage-inducible protein A n=1 Tax=Natronobiforma cellulositropha TaxID=1679076 RepID=UPI0021D57AF4|nr:molybdopterin-binding protein [Natronobiforma cellulositropha]
MNVAIVTVGDELLAGRTVNTNASWLCERLHERGARVERVVTVPDRVGDIAETVDAYNERYDGVVVTGGLGPTHDDVTMDAIAAAFDSDLELHEEALEWLTTEGGYTREGLTEGTAHLPRGARALHNEVGVAPGAVLESVYVLPGVPGEMRAMFETVAEEFAGERRYYEEVLADEPESALLERLDELQAHFDVSVGSYPGEGVRISIESTDAETTAEAAAWLRSRVDGPDAESPSTRD